MSDIDDRLVRCFSSALPSATREEILSSPFEEITGWDSLRGVTLVAVLDEEFGAEIDLSELLDMESFAGVRRYLASRGGAQ